VPHGFHDTTKIFKEDSSSKDGESLIAGTVGSIIIIDQKVHFHLIIGLQLHHPQMAYQIIPVIHHQCK
jgi:hypothetical protein